MSETADLIEKLAGDVECELDAVIRELEAGLSDEVLNAWEESERRYAADAPKRGLPYAIPAPEPLWPPKRRSRSGDDLEIAYDRAAWRVREATMRLRRLLRQGIEEH